MPRLRSVVLIGAVGCVLAIGGGVGYRLHKGDTVRSLYCMATGCRAPSDFDRLCVLAALAEFQPFETQEEKRGWLADQLSQEPDAGDITSVYERSLRPPARERYKTLLDEAHAKGVPRWQCPALERVLAEP